MAFTIPESLAARARVTRGEQKVFDALRDHLPEDYLVYYDTAVSQRHPDFIIVGPNLGLVVLEVKDWRLETIAATTGDGVVLRVPGGEEITKNPVEQARDYVLRAVDLLKRRPLLRDGEYLRFAWGYGAVFPLLRREDVRRPSPLGSCLEDALGPGLVLTAEDLAADRLAPALRMLLPRWPATLEPLAPIHLDEIRGVLHPEIRIGWLPTDEEIEHVMGREQERIARTAGPDHRLLRGVSGSGKTMILICRARHLREEHPDWRILVVCFNRVLADHLFETLGADDRMDVLHFHRWCWRELERAGVAIPSPPTGTGRAEYWELVVPKLLLEAYDKGSLSAGGYQAVLVDEGQDFTDDWYRILLRALDPSTNSLFIALDVSQSIYRRKVAWRTIGIQIVGRTRRLSVNYRNTRPIIEMAYGMIREIDAKYGADVPDDYIVPDQALRDGSVPEVKRCDSAEMSCRHAVEWVRARLGRGVSPDEILVLGPTWADVEDLAVWLADAGVPARDLRGRGGTGAVRLSTIHSAKGLDAACVITIGAHRATLHGDEEQARRLLYIAMTRARNELCVSYYGESRLMSELAPPAGQARHDHD
jgi:hypothetical protein